ncbi:MAG: MGMT family protein [Candidatus Micrarchaeota archaeon]
MAFLDDVLRACMRIPKGKVATYSNIARAIGRPGAFRAVGNALNKNRSPLVPCHRVIRSDLGVGGFAWGAKKKGELLRKEGVLIKNGRVLKACLVRI